MTFMEWFNALKWIHFLLIATILLVFAGYVYMIAKVTSLEFVGGLIGKKKIRVFGILFGLFVVVYLLYYLLVIQPSDWVQISLLAGLVAITLMYALATREMAEEMKEQRYDTFRPIIDIKRKPEGRPMGEELASNEELDVNGLACILFNIGVGPAVDLYSFVQNPQTRVRQRHDYGTLAKDGETQDMNLSLNQVNGQRFVTAYYKDIYGRSFGSSRELQGERGNRRLGPLQASLQ